jgi:hypothetical protein
LVKEKKDCAYSGKAIHWERGNFSTHYQGLMHCIISSEKALHTYMQSCFWFMTVLVVLYIHNFLQYVNVALINYPFCTCFSQIIYPTSVCFLFFFALNPYIYFSFFLPSCSSTCVYLNTEHSSIFLVRKLSFNKFWKNYCFLCSRSLLCLKYRTHRTVCAALKVDY